MILNTAGTCSSDTGNCLNQVVLDCIAVANNPCGPTYYTIMGLYYGTLDTANVCTTDTNNCVNAVALECMSAANPCGPAYYTVMGLYFGTLNTANVCTNDRNNCVNAVALECMSAADPCGPAYYTVMGLYYGDFDPSDPPDPTDNSCTTDPNGLCAQVGRTVTGELQHIPAPAQVIAAESLALNEINSANNVTDPYTDAVNNEPLVAVATAENMAPQPASPNISPPPPPYDHCNTPWTPVETGSGARQTFVSYYVSGDYEYASTSLNQFSHRFKILGGEKVFRFHKVDGDCVYQLGNYYVPMQVRDRTCNPNGTVCAWDPENWHGNKEQSSDWQKYQVNQCLATYENTDYSYFTKTQNFCI